jgi:hypothetical protein
VPSPRAIPVGVLAKIDELMREIVINNCQVITTYQVPKNAATSQKASRPFHAKTPVLNSTAKPPAAKMNAIHRL